MRLIRQCAYIKLSPWFQKSSLKLLTTEDKKKLNLPRYVEEDKYHEDRQVLLDKLSALTAEQVGMQEELQEMRQYCRFYARHYSDLKLEFMHTKHFVLKELNKDLPTNYEFHNNANGLKLTDDDRLLQGSSSSRNEDQISRKVADMMGRIDELEQEVNQLRLENRSLKSKSHSRDDSQSSGSSKKSEYVRNSDTLLYLGNPKLM